MKFSIRVLIFVFAIALFAVPDAGSVPAREGSFVLTQPDGSRITLTRQGDEFSNRTTTTDGYTVVMGSDGWYYYAELTSEGLKPSTVRASDPGSRSAEATALLSTLPKGLKANPASGQRRRSQVTQARSERLAHRRAAKGEGQVATKAPGAAKALVLLVNFRDVSFRSMHDRTAIDNLLNQQGYSLNGATGSAKDYFRDNSSGDFVPEFDVYGPYTLPYDMSYYGANDAVGSDVRPGEMVSQACLKAATAGVNFSAYATTPNGVPEIENLIIIYAGRGENDGGSANTIWPHEWALEWALSGGAPTINGVKVNVYACSSELQGNGNLTGIGVICHEFAHVLGIPDFYDTDGEENGDAYGLGYFSLMDSGGYINAGMTPPSLTALEREMSGWLDYTTITSAGTYTLEPVYNDKAYKINTPNTGEFFIFENRNGTDFKWDRFLSGAYSGYVAGSGSGMLIYHVDQSLNTLAPRVSANYAWNWNLVNAYEEHECMRLIKARKNATFANVGRFFFPGTDNVTSYTSASSSGSNAPTREFRSWANATTGFEIANIAMDGKNVVLTVTGELEQLTGLESSAGQYDITVSWAWSTASTWNVVCNEQGKSANLGGVTDDTSYNIRGLKPGTKYEITVTESSNANNKATITASTRTLESGKVPTIDMESTYSTDDYITMRVVNMPKDVSVVDWFVDGVISVFSSRKMDAGSHIIEAKVTNKDKSVEYLRKEIVVE